MLLKNKVVLVTGGSRGIGAATCRVLAREGATVAVNYAESAEKANAVAAGIVANGGQAEAFGCDLRDCEAVEAMTRAIVAKWGRLDGVINNAVAGQQDRKFSEATQADYQNMFDFGCTTVLNTIRAARPIMKAQASGGRIVNIVSELWNMAPAGWSPYMAGKGAMVGISRSLAMELGPDNITINMVAPGWMVTEKVDAESEGSKKFGKSLPLGWHGSADEIGNACVFYLSHLAGYITGSYLPVTGGRITQAGM